MQETRPAESIRRATKVAVPLDPQIFSECRKVSAWKSVAAGIFVHIACFGVAAAAWQIRSFYAGFIAFVLIGALQLHLSILMHDGAHYLVLPNRKWNDLVSNLLFAIPLLTTVRNYRTLHLDHHQFSGHPELDPERFLYLGQHYFYEPQRTPAKLAFQFLKDVLGIHSLAYLKSNTAYLSSKPKAQVLTPHELALTLAFWAICGTSAWFLGWLLPFVLFWIGPMLTFTFLFLKMHGYGEHTGHPGPSEYHRTYSHKPHLVRDFFFYPFKSGLHLQHHLFASVPWYNLEKLKKELERHPAYQEHAALNEIDGYFMGEKTIFKNQIYAPEKPQISRS